MTDLDPVVAVQLERLLDRLTTALGQTLAVRRDDMVENREAWTDGLRAYSISLLTWATVCPIATQLGTLEQVERIERFVRFHIADVLDDGITLPDSIYAGRTWTDGTPLAERMSAYTLGIWTHLRAPFLRTKIAEILTT